MKSKIKKKFLKAFKELFNDNAEILKLLGFESEENYSSLYKKKFIRDKMEEIDLNVLSPQHPCIINYTIDEYEEVCSIDLLVLIEYMELPVCKLRYMEIYDNISKRLSKKGLNIIETEIDSINVSVSTFSMLVSEEDADDDALERFMNFYRNDYEPIIRNVFDYPEIKKYMRMGGVSAERLSFEELIDKGYLRNCSNFKKITQGETIFTSIELLNDYGDLFLNVSNLTFYADKDKEREEYKSLVDEFDSLVDKKFSAMERIDEISSDVVGGDEGNIYGHINRYKILSEGERKSEKRPKKPRANKMADGSYSNVMDGLRFCLTSECIQLLTSGDELDINVADPDEKYTIDVIDQPFSVIIEGEEESILINIYIRDEMGFSEDDPDMAVKLGRENREAEVTANEDTMGDDPSELIVHFLTIAGGIRKNFVETEKPEDYKNFDQDVEIISIKAGDDKLSFRRLSGKKRPNMLCETLFEGQKMMRPYMDEVMDVSMMEMMSEEELIELAEDGDEEARETLGMLYMNGDENTEPDPEKAAYWFTKMAEQENAIAQFNLSLFYALGSGVPRDLDKAVYWGKKAKENGDDDIDSLLSKCVEAKENIANAEAGNSDAMVAMAGYHMFLGCNVKQADKDEEFASALKWTEKAIKAGNPEGYWILALAYANGRGVEPDKEKSYEYYKKGAELGNAKCQNNLACMYMSGEYLEENNDLAFELMKKSAEQGYNLAYSGLGQCYLDGVGTEEDLVKAVYWFEKYLETASDPQLEQKVALIKMLNGMNA